MRRLLTVLKWGLLGLLLLAGSWVAFNGSWADAPTRPRPAVLMSDPLQVGRPSAYELLRAKGVDADVPTVAPWQCSTRGDCTSAWLARSGALREQLEAMQRFGAACDAASVEGVSWVEPALKLPEKNPAAAPIPQLKNITSCLRWLRAQATLAVVEGNDARALQFLQRADRAVRGLLEGAQSLIGHAIAWSVAMQQWQTIAVLAHEHPRLAGPLLALLRPLSPAALSSARWIASESAFAQAIMRDLRRSCEAVRAGEAEYLGWLDQLWCRAGLGYLPELTSQEMDAEFSRLAAQARDGAVAAAASGAQTAEPQPGSWGWRNAVGHWLVVTARPHWWFYVKRQADVELLRQAALLVLQMSHELPAGRAVWLQSQTMQAGLRERIQLDGSVLIVRGWSEGAEIIRLPLVSA